MKNECSIVRDLLPLYLEKMVSEDTAEYINEHLENCSECAAEWKALSNSLELDKAYGQNGNPNNRDALALKTVKKKIRKKRAVAVIISAVLTVAIIFTCINLRPATVDYGKSDVYSRHDMNEAIELIQEQFSSFKGCKLYSISYDGDKESQNELEHCNTLAKEGVIYDECIVFTTHFRSPIFGGGAWSANSHYFWTWLLARNDGGEWELLTWGVG